MVGWLFAIVLAAVTPSPAPSAQPAAMQPAALRPAAVPDAETIFENARKAWADAYPRYVTYTVVVAYRNGAKHLARAYDTAEDMRRNIVFAKTFSQQEFANPNADMKDNPYGSKILIGGFEISRHEAIDPVGSVALTINYDFGIALNSKPVTVEGVAENVADANSYFIIGRSGTLKRIYDVRLIDVQDGGATYHIGLTPLVDPKTNRLREMWVDAAHFQTKKILIAANFSRNPYVKVPWLVEYGWIDGAPYIVREVAQAPLDFGKAGMLAETTIAFVNLTSLPRLGIDWSLGLDDPSGAVSEP